VATWSSSSDLEGLGLRIEALRSATGAGVVFRDPPGPPGGARGRPDPRSWWGKLQEGDVTQESNGPVVGQGFGRKLGSTARSPRERTLEGSKASKRAERPCAGEPEGSEVPSRSLILRGNSWGQWTGGSTIGGARVPSSPSRSRSQERGLGQGAAQRGKPIATASRSSRRRSRSRPNPQGSKRPLGGGTAPREGKAL
jgi:hypothetical protein